MAKYMLITTGCARGFSELNYLLLGEWCRLDSDIPNIEVVNYHWDDVTKLQKDYNFTYGLFEEYLEHITLLLNKVHGVDYPVSYWRLLVGPWLYYFICIVHDRYQMLLKANDEYDIDYTEVPKYTPDDWVPLDFTEFKDLYGCDDWNSILYSEIISVTNLIPCKEGVVNLNRNDKRVKSQNKGYFNKKTLIKWVLSKLPALIPTSFRQVVFVESGIHPSDVFHMLLKLKCSPFSHYERVAPDSFPINKEMRNGLFCTSDPKMGVYHIINHLLPHHIPISYMEGYRNLDYQAHQLYPKSAKVIITANAYFSNEHFKVWVARQQCLGRKLLVAVHGGHHGTALFNGPGKLTEDISDVFYSWGWTKDSLPSPKLSLLKGKVLHREYKNILFIPYSTSKYSSHIDSAPISSAFIPYQRDIYSFFSVLHKSNLLNDVVVRIKKDSNSLDIKSDYKKYGVSEFVCSSSETLIESIQKSALVIVAYDSTVFLEAFTLNVPTCLLFDSEYWKLSQISMGLFDGLLESGVLHYNHKSLITHMQSINNNIDGWWFSYEVQHSVRAFVTKFALSSYNWKNEWVRELELQLRCCC